MKRTTSIAATMQATASAKRISMRLVWLRARSCWAKKFIAMRRWTPESAEGNLHRFARLRRLDFQRRGGREREHVGDERIREHFAAVVVVHHRIVVRLAGEGDFVFRGGEFLGKLHHGLVGFEIRI